MKQESKPSSFISKFHNILKNKNFDAVIKLDQQKARIYVFDKEKLQLEILPYFFRHNKFTSFIRQLNLYGFKKIKNTSVLCFTHPILANGQKFLSIVAKKKLRAQPEEEESHQIQQNQEINSVPHYNRLMHTQTSVVQPEQMFNRIMYAPQGYYPMLGNPLVNQDCVWSWGQSWPTQLGAQAKCIVPIPGLYPGTAFINNFRSFGG